MLSQDFSVWRSGASRSWRVRGRRSFMEERRGRRELTRLKSRSVLILTSPEDDADEDLGLNLGASERRCLIDGILPKRIAK